MRKLLIFLPLLFIQSCASANQVALKCNLHTYIKSAASEFNFDDVASYLIDYGKNEISTFSDSKIYRLNNLVVAPEVISFTIPKENHVTVDGKISTVDGEISINRNSLVVSGGWTEVGWFYTKKITGKCIKTSLPNLSSYGKQI